MEKLAFLQYRIIVIHAYIKVHKLSSNKSTAGVLAITE